MLCFVSRQYLCWITTPYRVSQVPERSQLHRRLMGRGCNLLQPTPPPRSTEIFLESRSPIIPVSSLCPGAFCQAPHPWLLPRIRQPAPKIWTIFGSGGQDIRQTGMGIVRASRSSLRNDLPYLFSAGHGTFPVGGRYSKNSSISAVLYRRAKKCRKKATKVCKPNNLHLLSGQSRVAVSRSGFLVP